LNPDLAALLETDEEARARIAAARDASAARLESVREQIERGRRQREETAIASLEAEAESILEEARREARARQARRTEYLEERRRRAETLLPAAVEAWVRQTREGSATDRRP